ncbi:hypothetical protein AVEN_35215-1 [Araneus ventricosus]|uniref:Uncharacterized protein n=1 Tax=Araneus ventricosus TaxID=182803 RepID=A0A4Y2TGY9_ARAVE|nr:hypothetical protein AVEN_35215-1 [Araneus ventricosus]
MKICHVIALEKTAALPKLSLRGISHDPVSKILDVVISRGLANQLNPETTRKEPEENECHEKRIILISKDTGSHGFSVYSPIQHPTSTPGMLEHDNTSSINSSQCSSLGKGPRTVGRELSLRSIALDMSSPD